MPRLRRRAARARARRPGAAARPPPVLLEEREVGARADADASTTSPGFWESVRLPQLRRPVARAAVLERLSRAAPVGWRTATVREVVDETPRARTLVLDVAGLARPPRRPARRRAPHRRGRLPGAALVLDRLGARARRARAHRRARRRRRGLALPGRGAARRATSSSCAGRSAGTSPGGRRRRPAAARRPAAPGSCRSCRCCATARRAAATSARACSSPPRARRRALRATSSTRSSRRRRSSVAFTLTRAAAAGLDRLRAPGRRARCSPRSGPPPADAPAHLRVRADAVRRARRGRCSSSSATTRGRSTPSASAPPEDDDGRSALDGNALAGLLAESSAGDDDRRARLRSLRRPSTRSARTAPTAAPASCCAARPAATSRCGWCRPTSGAS